MEKNLTYEKAYSELSQIAEEIENETISIDILSEKVKRASFLMEFCKEKLRATETEVNQIISQMEKTNEKPFEKPVAKTVDKPLEKKVENRVEKPFNKLGTE